MTSARRYDPFAPSIGGGFPERRLRRAGVDGDTIARLRDDWSSGMTAGDRADLARFVSRSPDSSIRDRFQGRLTREQAEDLNVEDLRDRLRERPGGLSTTGRKAELVDRLLASFDTSTPSGPSPAADAASAPQSTPETPEAPETADSASAPADGADTATARPSQASPAAPTETPDATQAPATAATTQEDPRG